MSLTRPRSDPAGRRWPGQPEARPARV